MTFKPGCWLVSVFLGVVFAAVGCAVVVLLGKPTRDQALASRSWPATEGTIIRSRLEQSSDDGKVWFSADIGYDYRVGGEAFTGHRVWFGDDYRSSPGDEFRDAVDRYPLGSRVTVHYDPARPAQSVLEPGLTWSGSAAYFVGLGLVAVGSLLLIAALVPLLLVLAFARRADSGRAPPTDADRRQPPSSPGGKGPRPAPASDADDGITIR